MTITRRSLFRRAAAAAIALPFVGLAAAPQIAQAAPAVPTLPETLPIADHVIKIPRINNLTPILHPADRAAKLFQCPHGCRLETHYSIDRLAHVFAVWPADSKWGDRPRATFVWERFDAIDGYDQAVEIARKLTAEDTQRHSNEDWHHGWEHGVAHGKAITEQESAPSAVVAGALYDFMGYLTTRPDTIKVGSGETVYALMDAFTAWTKERGVSVGPAAVMNWQDRLT